MVSNDEDPEKPRAPIRLLRNSKPEPQPLDPNTFPHKPHQGGLPGTLENLIFLLEEYAITVRYDVIQKKLSIHSDRWSGEGDNADNTAMANIVSLACLNRFPRNNVEAFVAAIGDARPFNPVKEWIESQPWDGRDRLPDIYDTLTEREDYPTYLKELLVRKWLLSAVAAATLESGFRCRGVLNLQGPQRIGKTQWVAALVPDPTLRAKVVKLDHHLDAHSKDSVVGAVSHWICELGELDSAMRKDVARLKGVLTRDSDKLRKVYLREESNMPRRTVFAATVNHANFLVDDTGNSRWWVIPVKSVNWRHGIDMAQLFAQLLLMLREGAEWWLDEEEEALLELHNRGHRTISAIEDMVLEAIDLDRKDEAGLDAFTPRQLLMLLGYDRPTNPDCKECAGVLREYLGESKRINGRDKWRIPLIPNQFGERSGKYSEKAKNYD